MTKKRLFALAAVLIVLGVGLFVWEPAGPETECAEKGAPSSGFVDEEKNCPITMESWDRIRESESGPQWDNIGGLVLVVGGVAAAVVGAVRKPKPTA
jgi:hypothetical protein